MADQVDWLWQPAIKAAVYLVVFSTIAAISWLLVRRWRRSGAVAITDTAGRTVSSPRVAAIATLCAGLSIGALALGLIDGVDETIPDNFLSWALVVVGFAAAAAICAVVASHRWAWDSDGIVWHGAWRTRTLRWVQIKEFGRNWAGYYFVRSEIGGTIYWSEYTYGYQALNAAIAIYRPDLIGRLAE